jgi:hypothetical protein
LADVSLVIPSRRGGPALDAAIEAFAREGGDALEIVVAACAPVPSVAHIRDRWPAVRVVHFDAPRSIPELRAAGFAAATAPIVAMTSDACVPMPGWLDAVRRAHAAGADAAGGAIDNGSTARLIDWAVFFCEYGRYLPPLSPWPAADLPGPNVSYTRAALERVADLVRQGTWEPLWHWRLAESGARLVRDGTRIVIQTKRLTFSGFVRERFEYGRSFAAQRTASASPIRRALFTAGCLALPVVVLVRFGRDLLPKRHLGRLLLSIPYLAVFACVWAAGEAAGYSAGAASRATTID